MKYLKEIIIPFFICIISCKEKAEKKNQDFKQTNNYKKEEVYNDTLVLLKSILKKDYPKYSYFNHYIGDIDNNDIMDIILVGEKNCTDENLEIDNSMCRITIFLKNQDNFKFKIVEVDNQLIDCSTCGGGGVGDPFRGIEIDNGIISFKSLYGGATKTLETRIFQYEKRIEKWKQIQFIKESYNIKDTLVDGSVKRHIEKQTPKQFGEVYFGNND